MKVKINKKSMSTNMANVLVNIRDGSGQFFTPLVGFWVSDFYFRLKNFGFRSLWLESIEKLFGFGFDLTHPY